MNIVDLYFDETESLNLRLMKENTDPAPNPKPWPDIPKDWEKIPFDGYKFVFDQVKARYDEIIAESESITNKSFQLVAISTTVVSAFAIFTVRTVNTLIPSTVLILIIGGLFVVDMLLLLKLLFPKGIIFKGSPPNEIFINSTDNPAYEENDKVAILYYNELLRYQDRIDTMNGINTSRQHFYKGALIATVVITILTLIGIFESISRP